YLAYLLAALLHPSDHPSTWVGIYAPPVNKDARLTPVAAAGKRPGRPSERGQRGGDEHQRAADDAQGAEPLAEQDGREDGGQERLEGGHQHGPRRLYRAQARVVDEVGEVGREH